MKQTDLIKLLIKTGWQHVRSGRNHELFTNGKDIEVIPRHKEVNEKLAQTIIKRRGLK